MITTFLLCRQCQVLHPVAPAGDPRFADEEAVLELRDFRAAHEAHVIEDAERVIEDALFDRPSWDPMATRWFHVAAGANLLLVRSWRATIDDPRRYELELTALSPDLPFVDVDERLLRRALDRHFFPQALRPKKLEAFVGIVHDLIDRLDAAEVETSFDDVSLPNASIGPFPEELCDTLLDRCAGVFDVWELERLRLFVSEHRQEDGALAVRVRRVLVSRAA
jgi:hypothetical protein